MASLRVNRQACNVSLGMECQATHSPAQLRAIFTQTDANTKTVQLFGPTLGLVTLGTVGSATGASLTDCGMIVYPPSGSTREVKVYGDGVQVGATQTVGLGTQDATRRNVNVYFGADANVTDTARVGRLTVRGYTVA